MPEGTASDSEAADLVRRQVITEQLEIFRSKPFVAGAIFWTYQYYRTRSNFIMGLVDAERNRRGSWDVLREEYAPLLIDSLKSWSEWLSYEGSAFGRPAVGSPKDSQWRALDLRQPG